METVSTLKFAQRAKSVNTAAKVNEVLDDKALIRKLRKENETLKQQLQAGSSSVEDSGSLQQRDREWTEVQTRLEDMSRDSIGIRNCYSKAKDREVECGSRVSTESGKRTGPPINPHRSIE